MTPPQDRNSERLLGDKNVYQTMLWWRLNEFPEYEVSEYGDLRNIATGRILKKGAGRAGHIKYALRNGVRSIYRTAGHLVALAFLGPKPFPKAEAAHWDGNPKNNHYSNLRWATRKENDHDRDRHGTRPRGSDHANSKLTAAQVRAIRSQFASGVTGTYLAAIFGVHFTTIYRICRSASYKQSADAAT